MELKKKELLTNSKQIFFMNEALKYANIAVSEGSTPIGCVIVNSDTDQIIAHGYNQMETNQDPTAHAEIVAIRKACEALGNNKLINCDIYVTLEPCAMCAAAISQARVRRLYYGADDMKSGAVNNGICYFNSKSCNHKPEVYGGLLESESSSLLRNFFKEKR